MSYIRWIYVTYNAEVFAKSLFNKDCNQSNIRKWMRNYGRILDEPSAQHHPSCNAIPPKSVLLMEEDYHLFSDYRETMLPIVAWAYEQFVYS